jgi:hypothetical protein
MYQKGFWLILIENDDSEMAVACQILSRENGRLRLQAHIPPAWYPQVFTAYKVHEDGEILGFQRLPPDRSIRVPAHAGVHTVDLELEPVGVPPQRARDQEPRRYAGSPA